MGHTLPLDTCPNGVRKLRNTAPAKRDQVWPESFHHEPRISDVICEPRRFRSRQVRSTLFLIAFSARSPFLTGPPNSPRYQALPFTLSDPFYIPIETKFPPLFCGIGLHSRGIWPKMCLGRAGPFAKAGYGVLQPWSLDHTAEIHI